MNDTAAWEEWHGMIRRMYNDRCTVCAEWRKLFDNFLQDMGHPVGKEHLKRHDENKEFCKENCYWG